VLGYEFPDSPTCNWYQIHIALSHRGHQVTDIPRLIAWFQCLADFKLPSSVALYMTEPCIHFRYSGWRKGKIYIALHLSHEMQPSFPGLSQWPIPIETDTWCMTAALSPEELRSLCQQLKDILTAYPIRATRPLSP
jgi:hypothetical protein